jgi:hypothetical protein
VKLRTVVMVIVTLLFSASAFAGVPTHDEYLAMTKWVVETGHSASVGDNICYYRKFQNNPQTPPSIKVTRVIEFTYCNPPWAGVNISTYVSVLYEDGTRGITQLFMDDADMDMEPNSIIAARTRVDENNVVVEDEIKTMSLDQPAWTTWLYYVHDRYLEETNVEGIRHNSGHGN